MYIIIINIKKLHKIFVPPLSGRSSSFSVNLLAVALIFLLSLLGLLIIPCCPVNSLWHVSVWKRRRRGGPCYDQLPPPHTLYTSHLELPVQPCQHLMPHLSIYSLLLAKKFGSLITAFNMVVFPPLTSRLLRMSLNGSLGFTALLAHPPNTHMSIHQPSFILWRWEG